MRNQHYVGQSKFSKWLEDGRQDPVGEAVRIGGQALEKVMNGAGLDTLTDRELSCLRGHLLDLTRAGDTGVRDIYSDVAAELQYRVIRAARVEAERERSRAKGH
jgi:hypothetical protein